MATEESNQIVYDTYINTINAPTVERNSTFKRGVSSLVHEEGSSASCERGESTINSNPQERPAKIFHEMKARTVSYELPQVIGLTTCTQDYTRYMSDEMIIKMFGKWLLDLAIHGLEPKEDIARPTAAEKGSSDVESCQNNESGPSQEGETGPPGTPERSTAEAKTGSEQLSTAKPSNDWWHTFQRALDALYVEDKDHYYWSTKCGEIVNLGAIAFRFESNVYKTAADVVDEVRIVFECAAVKDVLKLVPADIDTSLPYRLSNTFEKFLADHFEELGVEPLPDCTARVRPALVEIRNRIHSTLLRRSLGTTSLTPMDQTSCTSSTSPDVLPDYCLKCPVAPESVSPLSLAYLLGNCSAQVLARSEQQSQAEGNSRASSPRPRGRGSFCFKANEKPGAAPKESSEWQGRPAAPQTKPSASNAAQDRSTPKWSPAVGIIRIAPDATSGPVFVFGKSNEVSAVGQEKAVGEKRDDESLSRQRAASPRAKKAALEPGHGARHHGQSKSQDSEKELPKGRATKPFSFRTAGLPAINETAVFQENSPSDGDSASDGDPAVRKTPALDGSSQLGIQPAPDIVSGVYGQSRTERRTKERARKAEIVKAQKAARTRRQKLEKDSENLGVGGLLGSSPKSPVAPMANSSPSIKARLSPETARWMWPITIITARLNSARCCLGCDCESCIFLRVSLSGPSIFGASNIFGDRSQQIPAAESIVWVLRPTTVLWGKAAMSTPPEQERGLWKRNIVSAILRYAGKRLQAPTALPRRVYGHARPKRAMPE